MIRFRLPELIADAQFKHGRRITLLEIADATGINRMTLSRMSNTRGYSTSTDTIDKLCKYFGCGVGDIAAYVDDPVGALPGVTQPVDDKGGSRTDGGAQTNEQVNHSNRG